MPRKSTIIIFPTLKTNGSRWYVEWKYRIPGEENPRIERIYKGLTSDIPEPDRLRLAKKIIKAKTQWLKSGAYLIGSTEKVYADQLLYRNEARMYDGAKAQIVTTRTNISEFLTLMREKVNTKSYENYVSKLRIFNAWLQQNKLHQLSIKHITRQNIIDFSIHLSSEHKSQLTIKKYIQIIHSFFNFELDRNNIVVNPAERIPTMGKVVDCAAVPFSTDDRTKMKQAIAMTDPQLWLACQIQYYCAIRPGTELRLMKIKWIDFEHSTIRIPNEQAKNNKTEIVNVPSFLMDEFKAMQLHLVPDKNMYVFGKFGRVGYEPLGKNTLRNRFNRYREALEISAEHKFYSWKHTGAIQLIQAGAKPYDLKNHLRHASFATTEGYLKKQSGNADTNISTFATEI